MYLEKLDKYKEEDYLMLSGIQHFSFCRRQWALIHIEQQWDENLRTVEGNIFHKKAHDGYSSEKRQDVIISRGMPVFSPALGVSGVCDIVEFCRNDKKGISLHGREGRYLVYPVEYKKGQPKEDFSFHGRSRRPPLDAINALLSFTYTLLTNMCAAALETVGLDPYVGFMHTDRPGRVSLALDLMEELRPVFADRFVLSLINKRMVSSSGFRQKENGAVIMDDDTRKSVLSAWQMRKQEVIRHPFLEEKVEWGMVPYTQALLLARCIRGDLDEYPPFMWK